MGVGLPEFRRRRLKYDKMADLEALDEGHTDLFYNNWIDTYYVARPADLENYSLHRLFTNFDHCKQKPPNDKRAIYALSNELGWFRERLKGKMVATPMMNFNSPNAKHVENCFFMMMQLFVPYRYKTSR